MEKNWPTGNPKHAPSRDTPRPTIGFLTANITKPRELLQWQGTVDAAQERDANLLYFVSGELHNPDGFNAQTNVLYDLVNPEQLDGLVICSGILSQFMSQKEIKYFMNHYQPLPIISVDFTLAISSCYLSLYEKPEESIAWFRLMLVYNNEVKTLTHEGSRSAEDIAHKIEMIQTNSQETAHAITQVKERIHQIFDLSNTIEKATSKQTTITNEVSRVITDAARDSGEITRAMTEVVTATQDSSGQSAQV